MALVVVVVVVGGEGGELDESPFSWPPSAPPVVVVDKALAALEEACGLDMGVEDAEDVGEDSSAMGGRVVLNPLKGLGEGGGGSA